MQYLYVPHSCFELQVPVTCEVLLDIYTVFCGNCVVNVKFCGLRCRVAIYSLPSPILIISSLYCKPVENLEIAVLSRFQLMVLSFSCYVFLSFGNIMIRRNSQFLTGVTVDSKFEFY